MITIGLNETDGIALLEPEGELCEADFKTATKLIDPYIEQWGALKGILIHTKSFPGWDSFAALLSHLKFVKEHHKKVGCVALVTDSALGDFGEHVASHFISAKVKHFAFDDMDQAKDWIMKSSS